LIDIVSNGIRFSWRRKQSSLFVREPKQHDVRD